MAELWIHLAWPVPVYCVCLCVSRTAACVCLCVRAAAKAKLLSVPIRVSARVTGMHSGMVNSPAATKNIDETSISRIRLLGFRVFGRVRVSVSP
jgi:hypothetical protein